MSNIPTEALKLLSAKGFDKLYFRYLAESQTAVEAYNKTEKVYKKHFLKNRYSSFESFRASKNRRVKR